MNKKLNTIFSLTLFWVLILFFSSCKKEVQIDLPTSVEKIVVEGKIELGVPPYVILTRNTPYFGATNIEAIQNTFVHDAAVTVSDGTNTVTLTEFCSQSLPDSLLATIGSFTGISPNTLKNFNYCIYTTVNPLLFGQVQKTYSLTVTVNGKKITAATSILSPVKLDSIWSKYVRTNSSGDSLGFIWAHMHDPAGEQNAYRWLAKRIGKDYSFIAPQGATINDKYFNGQSFDFAYNRGTMQFSNAKDDTNDEKGFFKVGDTVIVKFCTIDNATYNFYRSLDIIISNDGNPFASPSSVESNVSPKGEALGIWCGYGSVLDTVIFK